MLYYTGTVSGADTERFIQRNVLAKLVTWLGTHRRAPEARKLGRQMLIVTGRTVLQIGLRVRPVAGLLISCLTVSACVVSCCRHEALPQPNNTPARRPLEDRTNRCFELIPHLLRNFGQQLCQNSDVCREIQLDPLLTPRSRRQARDAEWGRRQRAAQTPLQAAATQATNTARRQQARQR